MNLKLDITKRNCIYILCHYAKNSTTDKCVFYSEDGHLLEVEKISLTNCHILLAIIIINKTEKVSPILFDENEIQLLRKNCYNQIKQDDSYHFGTKGKIYGFGYGVKYNNDSKNRSSYGKYSFSK